ncbi:MAG TPA: response regulator [Solimonas sp.]|nr:response regulator [Solimonas sp.]
MQTHNFPVNRILVVDDETDVTLTLKILLEVCGQVVRIASDGEEALRLVASFRPQVILMDLAMPGMDGLATARAIRSMPDIEQPLMVAVTGFGQVAFRQATREAGFDQHLVKPVTFNRLTGILFDREAMEVPADGEPFPLQRGP